MGPRSIDRGTDARRARNAESASLQWGRDQSIAGLPWENARPGRHKPKLQWGRDQSIAELPGREGGSVRVLSASMGPRSIDRGTRDEGVTDLSGNRGFNGAAINRSRNCSPHCPTGPRRYSSFNGAAINRSRDSSGTPSSCCANMHGFNGAAINRSRNYRNRRFLTPVPEPASMGPRSIDRGTARS